MKNSPSVWKWQVSYCVLLAAMYLVVALMAWYLKGHPEMIPDKHRDLNGAVSYIYFSVFIFLAFLYSIGPFLPRRPWVWVYHLVLICFTMTSCCCIPLAIPLLIFWIKPETRAFFSAQ